jgi:hypothetical protein
MGTKRPKILSVAAALAAMSAAAPTALAATNAPAEPSEGPHDMTSSVKAGQPNTFVSVGGDLLGFTVDRAPDGRIIMADHFSHSSHSSHASHYSSRY